MYPGNVAIIGGTGFEKLPPEIFAEPITVDTRFGVASLLSVSSNYVEPFKLYFLSRHGVEHGIAPHQINYRANIAALVELDVKYVYATNAVGGLRLDFPPGTLVLLDDFIDATRQRDLTYFAPGEPWRHVDFSTPYSTPMREALIEEASSLAVKLITRGTYVGCDGPRFESPAEVRLFASWGGDVVGMTGIPEVIFAREAGLQYAALCIVTNPGAGLTEEPVAHEDVVRVVAEQISVVRELCMSAGGVLIAAGVNA